MNWELIISAIVGMLTGGGVSWLFKIKEDKAGSKADVVDSSTEAMNKMMTLIGTQQERLNAIIEDKDRLIEQQRGLINEYKAALEEANQKLKNLEFKVSENNRKIGGMQKIIESEISERKKAEHNICFVTDCKLRRPPLGTYKKGIA
jgi:peptidoglycan hydrolase CwlO-like protein